MDLQLKDYMPMITEYSFRLGGALAVLIIVWITSKISKSVVEKSLKRIHFDLTLTLFISATTRWAVLLVGALVCLSWFGIETTSFAAILGAGGLAIGLAFQGSLSNIASGVMLLIFRPIRIGDYVRAGGETGLVAEIGLFTTFLDTPDNRRMVIPNSAIFGSTIENVTYHAQRRVDVSVGCEYSADIDKTREVLEAAAMAVPQKLPDREVQILLVGLGASSVDWQVRVWVPTADFWFAKEETVRAVKYALDNAGIGIPFPQMDVYLGSKSPIRVKQESV